MDKGKYSLNSNKALEKRDAAMVRNDKRLCGHLSQACIQKQPENGIFEKLNQSLRGLFRITVCGRHMMFLKRKKCGLRKQPVQDLRFTQSDGTIWGASMF
ncbi:hypothetical protein [Edaphobacter aggregans]|jgi:hypothetical protein|uniref:hypothetical protein n=1 Tax=Edaphobacter aggregans TaxID=570835 RepID=UPI000F746C61|nr:hypothetical protein [Edaphobacter aggregans]